MKLHRDSVIELHELYHRKEGDRYIVGDPETGHYFFCSAVELRALQLIQSGLTLRHIQELLHAEGERVDLPELVHRLKKHHLVYRVDAKVIRAKAQPLWTIPLPAKLFGNAAIQFLLALAAIVGVSVLVATKYLPSPQDFYYQDSLLISILSAAVILWLYAFVRQVAKYGRAQALGIDAQFGITTLFGVPVPTAHVPPVSPLQQRKVLASSLLSLCAAIGVASLFATFTPLAVWRFVVLLGVLELLAECLLFLNTDLAKFVSLLRTDAPNLHQRTVVAYHAEKQAFSRAQKEDFHPDVDTFFVMTLFASLLGVILVGGIVVPILFEFIAQAAERFTPLHPQAADGILSVALITALLFGYGFALLRHHPLAHTTLFTNIGLGCVILGSYAAATLALTILSGSDPLLAALVTYSVGIAIAAAFLHAMKRAHPFSDTHTFVEIAVLPIVAACIPLSVLFTVPGGAVVYLFAAMLAVGMLTTLSFTQLHATRKSHRMFLRSALR